MHKVLDDAVLRFERVQRQLRLLDDEVAAFFKSDAHRLSAEPKLDGDSFSARWLVTVSQWPSMWWPVQIGEILYNLYSSLDYAAAGYGGKGFPIFARRIDFHERKAGGITPRPRRGLDLTTGMSDALRAAIEAEQPYNVYPTDAKSDPLWTLKQLRDTDTHAQLHVVAASFADIDYEVIEGELTGIRFRKVPPGALADGRQVARLTGKLVRPAPPNVNVRLKATLTIAFDDQILGVSRPVLEVLTTISDRVASIHRALREAFSEHA